VVDNFLAIVPVRGAIFRPGTVERRKIGLTSFDPPIAGARLPLRSLCVKAFRPHQGNRNGNHSMSPGIAGSPFEGRACFPKAAANGVECLQAVKKNRQAGPDDPGCVTCPSGIMARGIRLALVDAKQPEGRRSRESPRQYRPDVFATVPAYPSGGGMEKMLILNQKTASCATRARERRKSEGFFQHFQNFCGGWERRCNLTRIMHMFVVDKLQCACEISS
jgi:hypothetical protein